MDLEDSSPKQDVMSKALEEIGWSPNADIPMADEECQALMKEVEALMEERSNLADVLKQEEERCEKLQQHTKNAEATINHNMKLLQAYQAELRTETNLFKVYEREHSKMKQDLKNLDKEIEHISKYEERIEKEIICINQKIDERTNRIKWMKAMMEEWNAAMADGKKGNELIEKYCKEDQLKAKEQEFHRQKLCNEIEKSRAELMRLCDEQKSLEQNLNCTSNLYRTAHAERRQLVETWKAAVNQMTQREKDIADGEAELLTLMEKAKQKEAERKTYDNKLNDIIANNREVEAAIEDLNTETSDIKNKMQKISDMIILKENEVELVQKELQALANRVQQQRAENIHNTKQKEIKLNELSAFDSVLEKLEHHLAAMQDKNMSALQRLQMLDEIYDKEQKLQNELAAKINRTNGMLYRAQEQLAKLKDEEKTVTTANSGVEATITAISNNMQKTRKQLRRLTEDYYNQSFKYLQLEKKVIAMQGGSVDPEEEQKNLAYLQQLEEEHTRESRRLQVTEAQNKKLDENMRQLTLSYNADTKDMEEMEFKIKEAQVYCEGGVKRLKEETRKNQTFMVELNLLKLRIKQSEDEIAKCNDSSYNLEKHRLFLNRTIKDRLVEIKSQMDLLQKKKKCLLEEEATLKADIAERNMHINAAKARFELTSELLGRNEDGSLVTATQLKVEMAQEKQGLIEQGDELNKRVLKAEQEIKAMENTLFVFNISNDLYRKQYQQKGDPGEAMIEYNELQSRYCKALQEVKSVRSKILKIEKENAELEATKEELEKTLEAVTTSRMKKAEQLSKLQKEISDQKEKLQRADRDVKLAVKELKQRNLSPEFLELFEKELSLRELEAKNARALNIISDIAETDEEIGPKMLQILDKAGIQMPRLLHKSRSSSSGYSAQWDASSSSSKDFLSSTMRSDATGNPRPLRQASSTGLSLISIEFEGSTSQK